MERVRVRHDEREHQERERRHRDREDRARQDAREPPLPPQHPREQEGRRERAPVPEVRLPRLGEGRHPERRDDQDDRVEERVHPVRRGEVAAERGEGAGHGRARYPDAVDSPGGAGGRPRASCVRGIGGRGCRPPRVACGAMIFPRDPEPPTDEPAAAGGSPTPPTPAPSRGARRHRRPSRRRRRWRSCASASASRRSARARAPVIAAALARPGRPLRDADRRGEEPLLPGARRCSTRASRWW